MKTKLVTVFLAAASAIFAVDSLPTTQFPLEVKKSLNDTTTRNWFGYMRLGASNARPNELERVTPDLAVGCRFGLPVGALDLSASYTGTDVGAKGRYFYTAPRVSYFLYSSPKKDASFYAGPGIAFGGMQCGVSLMNMTTFTGIIPSLSAGYEMNRHHNWRSFFQIDVSQPAFKTSKDKPYMKVASRDLGPIAECSVGFGY